MKRIGFGQVEPNHLSAQRNGQIYAQLPVDIGTVGEVLENGRFVKYDYAAGKVNLNATDGEWMLVLNEVKLYDDAWRESYKDFALQSKNFVSGEMVPRLFKTSVGDIYTTNCLAVAGAAGTEVDMGEIALGDKLSPNASGYLAKDGDGTIEFKVVKVYTMPDGQEGVKLQRVK